MLGRVTNRMLVNITFHFQCIEKKTMQWKRIVTEAVIMPDISFVPLKKESHTGLEGHNSDYMMTVHILSELLF